MDRKNILLISFDDAVAPWPYKSAFPASRCRPRTSTGFAKVSTAFHSAYAQAPICGPSRASMMTTMMPPELGLLDNTTFVFDKHPPQLGFSHALKAAGLFCSSGGKVHHRYKPLIPVHHRVLYSDQRKGFGDDMSVPEELKRRSQKFGGFRNGIGTPDGEYDDSFYDAQSAASAISFLNDYDRDQPFYREVGFFSPHVPHITPARFKRIYKPRRLRKPAEWGEYHADNPYASRKLSGTRRYPVRRVLAAQRAELLFRLQPRGLPPWAGAGCAGRLAPCGEYGGDPGVGPRISPWQPEPLPQDDAVGAILACAPHHP